MRSYTRKRLNLNSQCHADLTFEIQRLPFDRGIANFSLLVQPWKGTCLTPAESIVYRPIRYVVTNCVMCGPPSCLINKKESKEMTVSAVASITCLEKIPPLPTAQSWWNLVCYVTMIIQSTGPKLNSIRFGILLCVWRAIIAFWKLNLQSRTRRSLLMMCEIPCVHWMYS